MNSAKKSKIAPDFTQHTTKRRSKKPVLPLPPPALTRCIVLIDGSQRRQSEALLYHKTCKKLELSTQELKIFEDQELEVHRLWMESTFTTEIAELQYGQVRLIEMARLIHEVQSYALCADLPEHVSYAVIMQAQADGTTAKLWEDLQKKETRNRRGSKDPEVDDLWQQLEDQLFGDTEQFDADPFERSQQQNPNDNDFHHKAHTPRSHAYKSNQDDDYLKGIYHKLVMVLHPDKNPEQNDEQKEAFFQAQEAYRWRDVHRLESLYQRVTNSSQGLFDPLLAPIAEIMERRKKIEKQLKELGKELREAKQHPAWGFLNHQKNPKMLARIAKETRLHLRDELSMVGEEIEELEACIQNWERRSKRVLKPKKKKAKI